MQQKKRVLLCEFHQESNTFNPITAQLEEFRLGRYLEGQAFYDACKAIPCAVHGGIDAIEEAGGVVVPSIALHASCSGGRVADDVLYLMCERVQHYVEKEGPFDAVYAALHGATATESEDDGCGVLLERLRELVGDEIPIAASFDLHANVTEKILKNADIVCGYQSYPHVDIQETGYRAASLLMKKLRGDSVVMAATIVPVLTPPSGYTNLEEPFKGVIDYGKKQITDGTLLDFSVFNVQPWMDLKTIGSTVIAIAEEADAALQQADVLAKKFFDNRDGYWPDLLSIDEIIDRAEKPETAKPVLLVDAADSPNGGAVGDSVAVALRLLERGSKIRAGMFVKDPEAVKKAFEVGVGNSAEFTIGAGFTPNMPGPLKAVGKVRSLHDGFFLKEGRGAKGSPCNIGLTAVISFGNVDIMVCESPAATGDPQLLRHFGIEPTLCDLVVVKANTSFKAFYGPFAGEICYGDTPGAGAANLMRFEWKNLPKQLYPFDLPRGYQPAKATIR